MSDAKDGFNLSVQSFEGKKLVFTGDLAGVTRRQAWGIVRELNANVGTKVSAATDFVIAGRNATDKLQDAVNNNVRILTEDDFFAIVKAQRARGKGPVL